MIVRRDPYCVAPSMPRDIKIVATRTNEMMIQWSAPLKPNGNVTHYHITCRPQKLRSSVFDQRNYCDNSKCHYRGCTRRALMTLVWTSVNK